jgi:hypothetical protein
MKKVCATFVCLLLIGCASQDEEPVALSVRVQFVPDSEASSGLERSDGAVWSRLAPSPIRDGDKLYLQAHAGIGHQFPVALEDGTELFDVLLRDGDDDAVSLEIISELGSEVIELDRDAQQVVQVAGVEYTIRYPSVYVGVTEPDARKTTNKAMLAVYAPK